MQLRRLAKSLKIYFPHLHLYSRINKYYNMETIPARLKIEHTIFS